ncbi:unnamed protein product, partial [Heterotrigona itama]
TCVKNSISENKYKSTQDYKALISIVFQNIKRFIFE